MNLFLYSLIRDDSYLGDNLIDEIVDHFRLEPDKFDLLLNKAGGMVYRKQVGSSENVASVFSVLNKQNNSIQFYRPSQVLSTSDNVFPSSEWISTYSPVSSLKIKL